MKISVGFSSPKRDNPLSWLIRKITKSKISHTWFLIEDTSFGIPLVLESHFEFRLIPYERFKEKNKIVLVVQPRVSLNAALLNIISDLGTPYDVKGIFGELLVLVAKRFKRKIKNPFRSLHEMFCSESIARVLKAAGEPGTENLDPESTEPEEMAELLTAPTP